MNRKMKLKRILYSFFSSFICFLLFVFVIQKDRTVYQNFISSLLTFAILLIFSLVIFPENKSK